MFNRGSLNRMLFNRTFSVEILASFSWNGEGEMSIKGNVEYIAKITMQGEGEFNIGTIRECLASIQWEGIGELSIDSIRERLASINWNGDGELKINASRNRVEHIEVLGPFAPGDKIIIDTKKLKVTKNGQTVGYEGDFFDLNTGNNQIVYTDTGTGRTVQFRITHRNKYI